jgi:hypothetical protein
MSAPENYTGKVPHNVLIPREKGRKWILKKVIAEYQQGRLMRLQGENFTEPPNGKGFTGEFSIIAVTTELFENARVLSATAAVTTFTVAEGRFVSEQNEDVDLSEIEGLCC